MMNEKEVSALDNRLKGMMAKSSTFVSIDIVDSTGIKMGERDEDIIYSFVGYQKLAESTIAQHQGSVVSITGDGVMAKFASSQDAVEASVHFLAQLPEFNKNSCLLKSKFQVRIGVNTGNVFEDTEQERRTCQLLPSKVIDMAGYLQKRAPTNGVYISQFTIEQMSKPLPGVVKDHYDEKIGFTIYAYNPGGAVVEQKKHVGKYKILIIEDEPDQAYHLAQKFNESGYEAVVAFDGLNGLVQYKTFQPDVVLIDIGLPRMDGWTVLQQMKSSKLASRVPVLMMARQYKMGDIERSLEVGASGCMRKPCDPQSVMRKVQALLQ